MNINDINKDYCLVRELIRFCNFFKNTKLFKYIIMVITYQQLYRQLWDYGTLWVLTYGEDQKFM